MTDHHDGGRLQHGGGLAIVGLGLLMVACCAGPALIAGGTLGALGAGVRNRWLITIGVLVVLAALGYTLWRRTRRHPHTSEGDCCAPPHPGDHTRPGMSGRPPTPHGTDRSDRR